MALNGHKEELVPKLKINQIFGFVIGCIALYSSYIILPSLPEVYNGWQSFFGQEQSVYPLLITALCSSVPLGFLLVAAFVYLNKRSYFIFPIMLIGWFLFVSYTVYLILILVLYWWFKQSAGGHLTEALRKPGASR